MNSHLELSLAVDEDGLGVLPGVRGETARKALHGVLVHPVGQQHDVRRQVEVVQVTVRVLARRLSDNDAAVDTVQLLGTWEHQDSVEVEPPLENYETNLHELTNHR